MPNLWTYTEVRDEYLDAYLPDVNAIRYGNLPVGVDGFGDDDIALLQVPADNQLGRGLAIPAMTIE